MNTAPRNTAHQRVILRQAESDLRELSRLATADAELRCRRYLERWFHPTHFQVLSGATGENTSANFALHVLASVDDPEAGIMPFFQFLACDFICHHREDEVDVRVTMDAALGRPCLAISTGTGNDDSHAVYLLYPKP